MGILSKTMVDLRASFFPKMLKRWFITRPVFTANDVVVSDICICINQYGHPISPLNEGPHDK